MTPSFSMGSSSQHQTNNPPAWAQPGLQQAGQDALKLYNQGIGFHTYTGPTQAPLSGATLSGLNGILAATGSSAPPVTNQSLQAIMDAMKAKMPAPQATPTAQPQQQQQSGRYYFDPATGRYLLNNATPDQQRMENNMPAGYYFDPVSGTYQPIRSSQARQGGDY